MRRISSLCPACFKPFLPGEEIVTKTVVKQRYHRACDEQAQAERDAQDKLAWPNGKPWEKKK
jgi:hypothetical protein